MHNGLVLTFKASDAPVWIAYSLDFDLMAQGEDEEAAIEALRWTVTAAAKDDMVRYQQDLFARAPAALEEVHRILTENKDDGTLGLQRVLFTFS